MRVNTAIGDGSFFENPALLGAFERARSAAARPPARARLERRRPLALDHLRRCSSSPAEMADDVDPRLHRRPRRLAARGRRRPRRAAADRIATVSAATTRWTATGAGSGPRRLAAIALGGHSTPSMRSSVDELRGGDDRRVPRADRVDGAPALGPATPRSSSTSGPTAAGSWSQALIEGGFDLTTMTRYSATRVPVASASRSSEHARRDPGRGGRPPAPRGGDGEVRPRHLLLQRRASSGVAGETRILVPSPRDVASYDLKPEMSAQRGRGRASEEGIGEWYRFAV